MGQLKRNLKISLLSQQTLLNLNWFLEFSSLINKYRFRIIPYVMQFICQFKPLNPFLLFRFSHILIQLLLFLIQLFSEDLLFFLYRLFWPTIVFWHTILIRQWITFKPCLVYTCINAIYLFELRYTKARIYPKYIHLLRSH